MGNAVLSPGIFGGGGGKPKQLCKQSCPTNALAARLMQLRIKCLLSNDIEHILQFTNIKAFPISDLSVSIIKSSQNAVLLSTSQLQKEAVWQHSLGSAAQDASPAPSAASLLLPCGIFLGGWGLLKSSITNAHTNPPRAQLFPQPKTLPSGHGSPCRTTTNEALSPPQGTNTAGNRWKSPGLAARQRRLLKLVSER